MEKATVENLIARKLQGDYDRLAVKTVELPRQDFTLELRKPDLQRVLDALDAVSGATTTADSTRFMCEIVYDACPMLHDRTLLEAFECKEPTDIVLAILNDDIDALGKLADAVLSFFGLDGLDAAIKN